MKNALLLLSLLLLYSSSNAQISLEHTYIGGSTQFVPNPSIDKQSLMVNLEVDGHKYVIIDRINKTLTFYNLDHSVFRTVSFAATTDVFSGGNGRNYYAILYISQHLFDLDDEIEFMYVDNYYMGSGTPLCATEVVNEDGTLLFSELNGLPIVQQNIPQQQVPIYNTEDGAKLLLSMVNGDENVYSLGGTLSPLTITHVTGDPFPNPFINQVTIPYQLPEGAKEGTLNLYNVEGQHVRTIAISAQNEFVVLQEGELAGGNYFVEVVTSQGTVFTKKLIKID